jgi:hypothetical protein
MECYKKLRRYKKKKMLVGGQDSVFQGHPKIVPIRPKTGVLPVFLSGRMLPWTMDLKRPHPNCCSLRIGL